MILLEPGAIALIMIAIFFFAILIRIPVAFALVMSVLPFMLLDSRFNLELLVQRMYAGIDSFVLLAVPFFIFAASLMTLTGVTDRLFDFARSIVGGARGGLGVVNVASSIGFSGMSGSSTADVSGAGSILIPQMIKRGYSREYCAAVTASSAVISSIIPPSIQLIVWGSLTNTSIGRLFLGAIIPGLLVGVALMFVAWIVAVRAGYPPEARFNWGVFWKTFVGALPAFGIIAIVFIGFRFGVVTATEAAVTAVIYAMLVAALMYRSLTLKNLLQSLATTASLTGVALLALAAASVIGYLLAIYNIPSMFGSLLSDIPGWAVLAVIVMIFLFIGCFLDPLPAMAIMIPVFAPFVLAAGIDPVQYGVVAIMTLAVGLVTPPVGICLLIASQIAEVNLIRVIKPALPFLFAILFIIALCVTFPQLVLWLPSLGA
ncbi:TRAP transporter large permease [Halomonas dongshanensis]|uniref:TRAP transporter large permease protein n=1 Tax=Halomonas dongshanensis TaxID=2890835 RepID=A0ABT2EAX3_9GAMM|nr:TRAP transporter large permease [Halomonas dongshanensis]MCS2608728.1 TRAP transporter large permease [Halomonas dongshanensis]